jgi:hypothetical protein
MQGQPPACLAEPTASLSSQPVPAAGARPRGNPNLHLVPRCGSRTRSGCPCRAPAILGKARCRMHGGRSTGPRTPEGIERLRAARTIHGCYDAATRARDRHARASIRRSEVFLAVVSYYSRLPPELAARLDGGAPELRLPVLPPAVLSAAEEQVFRRAEAEAHAPWKAALAAARAMGRRGPAGIFASMLTCAERYRLPHTAAVAAAAGPPAPPPRVPPARRDDRAAEPRTPDAGRAGAAGRPEPHAPELLRAAGTAAAQRLPARRDDRAAEPHTPDAGRAGAAARAKPHAPELLRATGTATAPAPPARRHDRAAEPHTPDAGRAGAAEQAEPHAPESLRAAGTAAAPALPARSDDRAAEPHTPDAGRAGAAARAEPHAPESLRAAGTATAQRLPARSDDRAAEPHAPDRPAVPRAPAPVLPPAPAQSEPHAPEAATRPAAGRPPPNRATRRWLRKQQRLDHKRATARTVRQNPMHQGAAPLTSPG